MAVELVERSGAAGTEVTAATSAAEMRARLQDMKQKISLVQAFFRDVMVQNEDYGVIPGTDKPTLLKPGAEKLCEFYGYSIHVATEREEKDRETGWYDCAVKVTLVSRRTGEVIAEGVGEANTYESRYRYRWVWPEQVPPEIDKSTLVTRKTKNGRTQYRLENDDLFSLWNTVKKMAKKRALIDATLSATRSSGIFTQDVEDLREWASQGEVIDAEYTVEDTQEPPKPQSRRRHEATNTTKGGDESKRSDYNTALFGYLSTTYSMSDSEYVLFVQHTLGGSPMTCDIDRLADLARYAYAAGRSGSKAAAKHIEALVDDWRQQVMEDMQPDDLPDAGDDEDQEDDLPF